ncbi:MAG: GH3 auxin-responsive promoter family protein [Faecalibacterium sp.]|nr:GH3 auxin-responsive promoter family protein [Ruminococcus sp.]MCM1391549.1 GH3 auxin-responsive promoter family protein [Ruminococcus sp.]MCM1485488.1 GH3 auxin-responsive promoter family protein [Faecalibacterium sp.]
MSFITDYGVFLGNMVFKGFEHYTSAAAETQEATLRKIMKKNADCEYGRKYDFANIHSIKEFQDKVPLSTFEDYAPLIDRMVEKNESNIITSDKVIRYCSSSGSVGKPKLQPKTFRDLWNMQCMGFVATPACASRWFKKQGTYKKLPTQMGPLVVSLNGHKLENGKQCNGAAQVPFTYLKPILKFFTTTPLDILFPEDQENTNTSYFQARMALECRDVTYIGSIVVTLLTTMLEYMENNWELLCNDIEKGTIDPSVQCPPALRAKYEKKFKPNPSRAAELRREFEKGFDTEKPIAQRIWPKLCWGYGMFGSTLATYVKKLRRYVGDLPLHNMGYGASEGFLAMPVELNASDYVLLPRSLVYEFLPLDAEEGTRPLTISELEVGKDYEIIVTNFSGLYRYRILDVVHVTGMYNNSPRIEFLYRTNMGMNLANEKTTTQMLDWVAEKTEEKFGISFKGYSFYPEAQCETPHYCMLVETESDLPITQRDEIEKFIDESFRECNEKYDKYRVWGMIHPAKLFQLEDGAYDDYKKGLQAQGKVLNQIKPVTVINTPEREEFFFSHVKNGEPVKES